MFLNNSLTFLSKNSINHYEQANNIFLMVNRGGRSGTVSETQLPAPLLRFPYVAKFLMHNQPPPPFHWQQAENLYQETLDQLNYILSRHRRAVVSVIGFSGAGKTYTAKEMMAYFRGHLFDAGQKSLDVGLENALDQSFETREDATSALQRLKSADYKGAFVSHFCQDKTMYPNQGDHREQLVSDAREWLIRIHRRSMLQGYLENQQFGNGRGAIHHLDNIYAGTETTDGGHYAIPPDQNILLVSGHDSRETLRSFYEPDQMVSVVVFREPAKMYDSLIARDYRDKKLNKTENENFDRISFRCNEAVCQVKYYGANLDEVRKRFPDALIIDNTDLPIETDLPKELACMKIEAVRAVQAARDEFAKILLPPSKLPPA